MVGKCSRGGAEWPPSILFSWELPQKRGSESLSIPLQDAHAELMRRQQDGDLRKRVSEYLGDDIPEYFCKGPIFYMARHLATPNHETVRFMHVQNVHPLPLVIGQDTKDIFVSQNPLKRYLGRLPILTNVRMKEVDSPDQYHKVTIVDFNHANGRPLSEIETLWGEKLQGFHAELCTQYLGDAVQVEDDAEWIDRHHRGDPRLHYEKFLALFLVHGVLFEDFSTTDHEELEFVRGVIMPAYERVRTIFGVAPLITPLQPATQQSELFWMAYPPSVADILADRNHVASKS